MIGEKLAADFLTKQGYEIIETNYRCKEGEVDIIAREGEFLVFVEVRTKNSRAFGSPEESVTKRKKEHLKNVAVRYQETHDGLPVQWRIDFVAADRSLGFHAPQESARLLAEAIDYARQAQLAASSKQPPEVR